MTNNQKLELTWIWDTRTYEPGFVVETADTIYLTEIKANNQLEQADVLEKAGVALQYCKYASEDTRKNGGKPWRYMLIPHSEVLPNMRLTYLAEKREFTESF